MPRKIVVTSALPYANGSIHIGHLVEYIQTDIWVRFQKMCNNKCLYFCADDTHGTPIMLSSRAKNITPEKLIDKMHGEHLADFEKFLVEFDNYYTTHSPENRRFSELIFERLNKKGSITKRTIKQTYCNHCKMALPDRFIKGTCPVCGAEAQYGDSCEACGATYQPTELIDAYCVTCHNPPTQQSSEHYFFKLADYRDQLEDLIRKGYTQKSVANKLQEWFTTGLRQWDISRDGPYFGFRIPGEENKFFYVWLDAPIGYMASAENYCQRHGLDFDKIWNSGEFEVYHFIGKDIMYFHALFWPAMLMGADFRPADKLFVHGFLTVNGQKMSKSRGTFINAKTYLKHLDPEYLRYYYAGKLTPSVDDIDLNFDDFISKTNSDLVGKFANLASRSGPMLYKKLDARLGKPDQAGAELLKNIAGEKEQIIADYEKLNYSSAVRTINRLADEANRYVENAQPWATIKTHPEKTRSILTAVINAVRLLTIYLKPILPRFAEKVERFLNVEPLTFDDAERILEDHRINKFERLMERVEKEQIETMVEESKENKAAAKVQKTGTPPAEAIKPECTIDDFAKVDLRVARVEKAEPVEGADKLLRLKLDLGGVEKTVLAGIAQAYKPEELNGRLVVCLANLKPRKMRFGLSEGMILASGSGGKDIYMLSVDNGAEPGQTIH